MFSSLCFTCNALILPSICLIFLIFEFAHFSLFQVGIQYAVGVGAFCRVACHQRTSSHKLHPMCTARTVRIQDRSSRDLTREGQPCQMPVAGEYHYPKNGLHRFMNVAFRLFFHDATVSYCTFILVLRSVGNGHFRRSRNRSSVTSTRSSGSDKTLTSEPLNHEIHLDSQFSRAHHARDDRMFQARSSLLPQRLDTHPASHVDNVPNHLDPTALAQKVLSETVHQRYALEVMQGESIRTLKEKQHLREQMEEAESVQSDMTSQMTETPPPLPADPPPPLDEQDCSTPTSTSSHFILPPQSSSSSLPYAYTTTSQKPVASVLPSVYAGSRSYSHMRDHSDGETMKKQFMSDDPKGGQEELKSKPPLPMKPKTVTFSDDVRSNSSKKMEGSVSSSSNTVNSGNNSSKSDEIVKNSVKNLTSKFEQQSMSNFQPTSSNSPNDRNLGANRNLTPRGYQPPPPYPGHRPGQESHRPPLPPAPAAESEKPQVNGYRHTSQSSLCSDQSTVSTISESSSVLADQQSPNGNGFDVSRNWYDSDSESLPSLPPVSSDSQGTSRYGRMNDHNKSFDSNASEPTLSVPVFAQADKIRSIYQSQNGFTSHAFHSRDTIEVVTAPDLPGYSQESGFFNESGDTSVPSPAHPISLNQSHSRRPITCYNPEPVYQNLPEFDGVNRPEDGGSSSSSRQPPPPPVRSVSRNLSHFTAHSDGRPLAPYTGALPLTHNNGDYSRKDVPAGSAGTRVPSSIAGDWRGAPPPYHAAVNKLRANGVPGSNPGALGPPHNQNKSENSAFSPTLNVSKC